MVGNITDFIQDAFDYYDILVDVSTNHSIDRYLLEQIVNGYVKYGCTVSGFVNHVDEWIRSLANIYKELGFDHTSNQVTATIDLHDQVIVIDDDLFTELEYIVNVQRKYGLLIKYTTHDSEGTTTLSRFFELIRKYYPKINGQRFKGLGSSEPKALKDVIMDPRTRRISRVTVDDIERTKEQLGVLVGKSDDEVKRRKELLLDFKFTAADIDT